MSLAVLCFLGEKILDKAFEGAIDAARDKLTLQKIGKKHEGIMKSIKSKLIENNKEESYFDNLQMLVEQSRIIDVLFNLSYPMTNYSSKERREYINRYIDNFFLKKHISQLDISIIKGIIGQQFEYCLKAVNDPDDETRKTVNHIVLQLAESFENQAEMLKALNYNDDELARQIVEIKELLQTSDIDFEYLHEISRISVENLGVRYNKEFNVDVALSQQMSRFCLDADAKGELYKLLSDTYEAIRRIDDVTKTELLTKLKTIINDLLESKSFDRTLLSQDIHNFINEVEKRLRKKADDEGHDFYQTNEYYYWRDLYRKYDELETFRDLLVADVLLITGVAGVGKSHSITHFVFNKYIAKNNICIFILGQHLNEELDPIQMIEKCLHIPYTMHRFLRQLNNYAEDNSCIIPFIIEGINEGRHSEIWKEYFSGMVNVFEKYENIKLIISIRNTYIKKCLPNNFNDRSETKVAEHRGFHDDPVQALISFFEYYQIKAPSFPILYSDFSNPLFLHTLCKTIVNSGDFEIEDYASFNKIFAGYLNVIEEKVSERCRYQKGLRLINRCVREIIEYSLNNKARYGIKIDDFYQLIGKVICNYGVSTIDFIQAMIESGLFYTEIYGYDEQEEYIQFSYEKYHNILAAQIILSHYNTSEEITRAIKDGEFSQYFSWHHGIVEELFILIPDKYGVELLDLVEENEKVNQLEAFINSLIWRNFNEDSIIHIIDQINQYIMNRKYYFNKFLQTLLIIAPVSGHLLNALFLHKNLMRFPMPERDSFWVDFLYEDTNYIGVLDSIVKLCKHQTAEYSKKTKEMITVLLVWSLASTNTVFREEAILSLVMLFQNNLDLAKEAVLYFQGVDDGYIKEGLYCSIYGAVMRSRDFANADELITYIYEDIFNIEEVYPHIIVRSHASGIIECLMMNNIKLSIDRTLITPPYSSKWYAQIPSQEEIDSYRFDYQDKSITPEMYSRNEIIDSMATNTGKKSGMYGDFGRYVFEGWVDPWEHHFIAQDLSNIATKQIFDKLGYRCDLHGEFDVKVRSHGRQPQKNERIGKKYQRISSFEMLARLADNFIPGEETIEYSTDYSEWHSKRFWAFLNHEENIEPLDEVPEQFRDEKEHIKTIFKPEAYVGPWQFNYRGTDPSALSKSLEKEDNFWHSIYEIPDVTNEMWAREESVEPTIDDLVLINYRGFRYVVLEMYNTWKSKAKRLDETPKEFFVKAVAMLAPTSQVITSEEKSSIKDMAESGNNYNTYYIFAREFYWSAAYEYFENSILNENDDEVDAYIRTGIQYSSPSNYDEARDHVISSYSMPSKYLVDYFGLKQREDGKWYDSEDNLICLDIKFDGFKGALIFRQDYLVNLMKEKQLLLAWGMYTEKTGNYIHYSTRRIASWDGDLFCIEEYDKEQWESDRVFNDS